MSEGGDGDVVDGVCDPFWENLPKRADSFCSDLLIKV